MNNSVETNYAAATWDGSLSIAPIQWRWGILAVFVLVLISIYPQVHLWLTSEDWQHAVAYNQGLGDEVAYAAYVNALIDGRPRRNDPYTGRDDLSNSPLPESLFSIQFVPAYTVALPARALGISATTAFTVLTPLAALASGLAVFWLIVLLTGNSRLAGCGVLVVLCLGTLASAEGMFSSFVGGDRHFDYLPFLRRYQPAASFPLFLLFLVVVCRFLVRRQRPILSGVLAAGILVLLVFSYFYLWTAALAWLAAIALLWLIGRSDDRAILMRFLAVVGAVTTCALIPYFIMISHSAETTRNVQALVVSRKPDLFSAAELLGAAALLVLAFGIRRNNLRLDDGRVLAAASFALLPFIVLNQQIITGRVLQPIHYKGFVTSYAVLISFVILGGLNWPSRKGGSWQLSKRALVWITIAALEWGAIESYQAAKRNAGVNHRAAEEMSIYAYFADQARKGSRLNNDEVILFDDLGMADGAPAASPFPVLWAPHMVVYPGVASTESKERLYKHLYYTGVGVKELDAYFHGETIYYGCAVGLFGFDRFIDGLNPNAKPITRDELNAELRAYARYIETFDKQRASSPRVSHVIIRTGSQTNLENLDRWYQRDAGEQVGKFTIYRIKLVDHLEDTAISHPVSRF
jgi:hypothetical protein